ncbi:hypothetical protein HNY73_010438 [Argiope bruennichi]|uniref:Uncharacterized protein n=1 Tax=Argiope bruennichi TaxID=94029 RepID=A0A8T0F5Y2_ARGBR|nr:hypothetical protein HNY73_010438 [Argiope bruennichi]
MQLHFEGYGDRCTIKGDASIGPSTPPQPNLTFAGLFQCPRSFQMKIRLLSGCTGKTGTVREKEIATIHLPPVTCLLPHFCWPCLAINVHTDLERVGGFGHLCRNCDVRRRAEVL